ncbi:hypothetical protein ACVWZW_004794 [Bradyrhizobium sp. F1.13.4]
MSQRAVARSLGLAQGTASKYLNRTRRAGLTWPLPPELDNDDGSRTAYIRRHSIGRATSVHSRIGRWCIASYGARTSR